MRWAALAAFAPLLLGVGVFVFFAGKCVWWLMTKGTRQLPWHEFPPMYFINSGRVAKTLLNPETLWRWPISLPNGPHLSLLIWLTFVVIFGWLLVAQVRSWFAPSSGEAANAEVA